MGVHSGVAELRDGDYYGSVTNRAARLMSVAHGGQVVVSHTTAELAGDTLVDVTFLDLGEHRLRDLERPEHVLQVCHDDLEHDFPPLRSLDAFPATCHSRPPASSDASASWQGRRAPSTTRGS